MRYVRVAVNMPQVSGMFDYHLPPELEGQILPGQLVMVPFGPRTVQGIIVQPVEIPEVAETKAVLSLVGHEPILSEAQIRLAEIMSTRNLAPMAACVDLMIPPGISRQVDTEYQLRAGTKLPGNLSPLQNKLIAVLAERGAMRSRQIAAEFKRQNWKPAIQSLVRRELVSAVSILNPPTTRVKTGRKALLAEGVNPASLSAGELGRGAAGDRRLAVLQRLAQEGEAVEPAWLYAETGATAADLRVLEDKGWLTLESVEVTRDPLADKVFAADEPPTLTERQVAAVRAATEQATLAEGGKPVILHGVTGSGKTEVYLRLAEQAIKAGKQVLVMVPEISLTPQTTARFLARFPDMVGIQHSRLSDGERFDTWRRLRAGELKLIVGPRSALFMSYTNLGLIVIDEFHDDSYYQDDFLPAYDAVMAAIHYARLTGSRLVLGSATPDLRRYYQAKKDGWPILTLPDRLVTSLPAALGASQTVSGNSLPLPSVRIVDMRNELKAGNLSIFSNALQEALRKTVAAGQQAILYLNRRGSSTYVFCRDCGHVIKCPNCELPLTAHEGSTVSLACHTCGYTRLMPASCPACGSKRIKQFGTGTEKVEEEVLRLLPGVRTLRWDAGTTQAKDAHDVIMTHFRQHQADILVGTQMLTKGLDLPLVTLVGVVLADVGLNLPDYRAAERTFQHLMQVAGRAGRSVLGGTVILQSFMPDHYAIQSAAKHDFAGFYQTELEYRRKLRYPPFRNMVRLVYEDTNPEKAKASALLLAERLKAWAREANSRTLEIVGPNPPFYSRINRRYRWQILVKGADPVSFLQDKPLADWQIQVNPPSIL